MNVAIVRRRLAHAPTERALVAALVCAGIDHRGPSSYLPQRVAEVRAAATALRAAIEPSLSEASKGHALLAAQRLYVALSAPPVSGSIAWVGCVMRALLEECLEGERLDRALVAMLVEAPVLTRLDTAQGMALLDAALSLSTE